MVADLIERKGRRHREPLPLIVAALGKSSVKQRASDPSFEWVQAAGTRDTQTHGSSDSSSETRMPASTRNTDFSRDWPRDAPHPIAVTAHSTGHRARVTTRELQVRARPIVLHRYGESTWSGLRDTAGI